MLLTNILDKLAFFVFLYPLGMSIVWSISASYFAWRREKGLKKPPFLTKYPFVSIIVPFYNEEDLLKDTINSLLAIQYPKFEIILVDDGSQDKSTEIAKSFNRRYSNIRLFEKPINEGKVTCINQGVLSSKGDILLFIDADAIVDKDVLKWIVPHFVNYPRVGAVTGNPFVRNRTSLISRVQTVEYSSIISLIKRAHRVAGKIFTVSGVISAIRRTAITDIGFFDASMATEDIDISWRLQKRFYDIRFEPNAIAWINVPETLPSLFKQRLRWSLGGLQVLVKHFNVLFSWKNRRFWPIYFDSVLSVIWAFTFYVLALFWLVGIVAKEPLFSNIGVSPIIQWYGSVLALASLIQMAVSSFLNFKYDRTIFYYFFWAAWYPVFYWLITSLAVIVASPLLIIKRKKKVTWHPPRKKKLKVRVSSN